MYTHKIDDAIANFDPTLELYNVTYDNAISLKIAEMNSPINSESDSTGFMRQMRQKPIFANFPNFLAPIFAEIRNLRALFETNRGGHPSPFRRVRDGLSLAKNPE